MGVGAAPPPVATPPGRYRLILVGTPIWFSRPAAPLLSALSTLDLRGAAVAGFFTLTHGYDAAASVSSLAEAVRARGGRYLGHFTVKHRRSRQAASEDAALLQQVDSLVAAHLPSWQEQAKLGAGAIQKPLPRPQAPTPRSHASVLVGLQPRGSKPPLFCVTSGYGDVLALAALAQQIGPEQPFYVLQPSTELKAAPLADPLSHLQHRLALTRTYAEAIRQVAPTGPYRIAGYSAGGLMAAAVAEYLTGGGAEVEHLILLDPAGSVPGWEYRLFLSLKSWVNRHIPSVDPRRSRVFHVYHAYFTDDGFLLHVGAVTDYVPSRAATRITFVNARDSLMRFTLRLKRWRRAVGETLEFREVPGDHLTFFRMPNAATLALCLRELLREDRPRPTPAPGR
jgi:thioesterase domain-containing protein